MRIWRAVAEAEYRYVNHSTYSTLFLWDSGTLEEKKIAATRLALDPQAQSLLPVGIYRWIPYSFRFIQCRNGGKRHLLINPCSLPNKLRDVHDSFELYVFTSIGIETRDHQLAGFKEDLKAMPVSAQSLHWKTRSAMRRQTSLKRHGKFGLSWTAFRAGEWLHWYQEEKLALLSCLASTRAFTIFHGQQKCDGVCDGTQPNSGWWFGTFFYVP